MTYNTHERSLYEHLAVKFHLFINNKSPYTAIWQFENWFALFTNAYEVRYLIFMIRARNVILITSILDNVNFTMGN